MSNPSITADKTPWYQWDTGLTVTVSGGAMTECHFANRKQGTAYVQAVINGIARVPDELLQVAAPIKAYGYVSDGAGGQTYVEQSFEVIARNIPSDYTYTKTAQKTIRDAEAARDQAVQASKDAKASELAAGDSAVEASKSAQSAGESASAAATSASNATKSAGDAAKSASDAKAAASKAVEDASELLKTYTDKAKTSADNAATSASNAADAASAASGRASAAAQSATDASNAKAAAQTAKAEAETARNGAATSASNAATSATAAANSASDAAASVNAINVIAPKTVDVSALSEVDGSVAVGAGSVAKKSNELSIGNDTLTREITHVSTPIDDTSAATKKYTDDNDAKTLSEAKKYTDDNTSNALVGSVSGKLLHVDDAWPGKPLSLTIDGAYKQDGTPSPEAPVPIVVIENPVLKVTGRNLLSLTKIMPSYNDPVGTKLNTIQGKYPFASVGDGIYSTPQTDAPWIMGSTFISDPLPAGNYYVSFTVWSTTGSGTQCGYQLSGDYTIKRVFTIMQSSHTSLWTHSSKFIISNKLVTVEDGDRISVSFTCNTANPGEAVLYVKEPTVSPVANIPYMPYTSATLPITLPSEHPYLAALPDGTHDELVVKDGRMVLVKRVGSVVLDGNEEWGIKINDLNGIKTFYTQKDDVYRATDYTRNLMCDCLGVSINNFNTSESACVTGYGRETAYQGQNWLYVFAPGITTTDGIKAFIAEHKPTVNYRLATTETIDLGPADPIILPETVSNVWIESNLTPECSMTYKRDINIAFDNIVQAVVAAAAGE